MVVVTLDPAVQRCCSDYREEKNRMRHVVFFRELERSDSTSIRTLKESVNHLNPETARLVADYLEAGIVVIDSMEAVGDPLDPQKGVPGGSGLKTDGIWYWRQDLAYFVRTYSVFVPTEFIEHVLNNQPPEAPDETTLRRWIQKVDETHREAYRKGLR